IKLSSRLKRFHLTLHDALPIFVESSEALNSFENSVGKLFGIPIPCPCFRLVYMGHENMENHLIQRGPFDVLHEKRRHVVHESLRSEEHTSELQSRENLVCRLLL